MISKKLSILFAIMVVFSLVLAACTTPEPVEVIRTVIVTEIVEIEGEEVVVTKIVEVPAEPDVVEEPVTLNYNWGTEPPTADPALTTDTTSVVITANLFTGLTRIDPDTSEVVPYLATSWDKGTNADGEATWTFHLRDDFAWVRYDPTTGETTQEVDADGNPRFVNAFDVEYGVKRTIDPVTASGYAYVLYVIKNALAVNEGEEGFTNDDVGVKALDAVTVEFTLEYDASYFPSIAAMWVAYPVPQWAIEEWEVKWTEAGLIVTSGPYVMDSWIHGAELNFVKNPLWVDADSVQIERIEGVMITASSTAFAMYENNELDLTGLPSPEVDRVKADPVLSAEYRNAPAACTYYYGFTNNKPPMDDLRVRRAFSMAIDRQSIADNVLKGGQIPASTFAPPGIFGAVTPGKVGVPFDTEAAKASLQEYLDEKGMTVEDFNALGVTLMHNTSEGHANIAAAIQQMWKDTLGVEVSVENQEWTVYLTTIGNTTPLEDMPHVWRLGWCADYADQNNWVHEVFHAEEGANRLRRGCVDHICTEEVGGEFDQLTYDAAREADPATRIEMYERAEHILAWEEAAYIPIYHYTSMAMTKPWLTRNFPNIAGAEFATWSIDWDAKLAAR